MKLKKFQRDHYARAALVKGLMLAHEQGTGKSFAAFCISYVWRARRVLIAAPLDLHDPLSNPFSPCTVRLFRISVRGTKKQILSIRSLKSEPRGNSRCVS